MPPPPLQPILKRTLSDTQLGALPAKAGASVMVTRVSESAEVASKAPQGDIELRIGIPHLCFRMHPIWHQLVSDSPSDFAQSILF